jgi:hypothetical protein
MLPPHWNAHYYGRPPLKSPACRARRRWSAANTATTRALYPLPRVRGVSLRWVPGLDGAPGVYWGIRLKARALNAEAALAQSRGIVAP